MKRTSQVAKKYIHRLVEEKGQAEIDKLQAEIDVILTEENAKIEKLEEAIEKLTVRWDDEAKKVVSKCGLTILPKHARSCSYDTLVTTSVTSGMFAETMLTGGYNDKPESHPYNKRVHALELRIERIEKNIEREFERVVAAIEFGDASKSVEDLISGVKF